MFKQTAIKRFLLATFAAAHSAGAQQTERVYRIGYLSNRYMVEYREEALCQGLKELGYVEGKNLVFEWRFTKGNRSRLDEFAAELVRSKVDFIVTSGVGSARAAKQATNTIPIVMGNSSADPVRHGLIDSLARPGGNVTGVIDLLPDLAGKQLELLKEIFPKLSRIAHLSPGSSLVGPDHLKATEAAGRALGVRVDAPKVGGPDDLENAFRASVEGGAEALIVVGVSFFIPHRPRIVNLEIKNRLPTMHTHTPWVPLGGLISYSTDVNVRYRRAAQYVDKIFKGTNPTDLPVEQPTKFNLEKNLKPAKALGITIPPSILLRATKVIE